ncbi:MAG: thiamine diphosphokinase [Lachnospiraceae bacterium]|nr:thiamine diphosphokinase [Lachnospiraceae bacterium]
MKKCLIISGGDFAPIENKMYDFIIACDRGYSYALQMNITPDLIIGDFDSYDGEFSDNIEVIRLPEEKDDTDTMHAVKYAMQNGYQDITICCAFGGRLDHTYANIQTASYISEHGGHPCIIGKDTVLYIIRNTSMNITRSNDSYISVFSYSQKCTGVSLKGLKYAADNIEMTSSFPLGVSNEWAEPQATVSVKSGTLLIIISKKTM